MRSKISLFKLKRKELEFYRKCRQIGQNRSKMILEKVQKTNASGSLLEI